MTAPGQGDDATWAGKLQGNRNPVPVSQPAPVAANVVGGRAAVAGGEVLRVPAGRTWRGQVHLACSASAAIGAAAAVQTASLVLAGVGAKPAPDTLLELPVALPATTATATQGVQGRADATLTLVIVAAGADAVVTMAGNATAMRASARGELIA